MRVKASAAQKRSRAASAGRWRISPWNGVFLGVGFVLALLCARFGVFSWGRGVAPPRLAQTVGAASSQAWGNLEITPIVLERPEEYFAGDPPVMPKITWFFRGYTPARLTDFLMTAGLSDAAMSALADTNHWKIGVAGVWVEPPLEVVRDLDPAARERLYRELAEHAENVPHRFPFVYRKDGFEEWFAHSGLPEHQLALIKKMTFLREGRLCFSDSQYFQLTLPSNEVRLLARALSRVPTLLMTLRVTPQSDIDALLKYWGTPERNRSLRPLLQSLARVPEGASLNISHFFPPVPQSLLYTYPNPKNLGGAPKPPDCFWTGMNFANETRDHRFLDSQYVQTVLAAEYHRVPKADAFGDVILFYEPGERWQAVHMCVFIAEDVVFTKNGSDLYQPWVLMHLNDMLINYPTEKSLQMAVFRRNRR